MDINVSQPFSHELEFFDNVHNLIMLRSVSAWQGSKKGKYLLSVFKVAAGEFSNNKGMARSLAFIKNCHKLAMPASKVLDPDGRVNQDHCYLLSDRLRAGSFRPFSVPPN